MKSPTVTMMLAAAVLAAVSVTPLPAQSRPRRVAVPVSLQVIALNDLEFNGVLRGIPKSVNVHDARYSGLFEIQGQPNASVRIELSLPTTLSSVSGGAMLPITFGAGDGYADYSRAQTASGRTFDPHTPVITTLSPAGNLFVRLGGTVLPSRAQDGGTYRYIIVLTVYDLGT